MTDLVYIVKWNKFIYDLRRDFVARREDRKIRH